MAWDKLAPQVISRLSSDLNLTPQQAAGIVGQLGYESAGLQAINEVNPVVPGSRGGFGWAQWTGPRRRAFEQWAQQNRADIQDPETNYQFLLHELTATPEGRVLDSIRKASDAQAAGRIFTDQFLRPGVPAYDKRASWTEKALNFIIPTAQAATLPDTAMDGPWAKYAKQSAPPASRQPAPGGAIEATAYADQLHNEQADEYLPQASASTSQQSASGADGPWAKYAKQSDVPSEPSALANAGRGLLQGVGDVFAGAGQSAAHETLKLIESIAPNSGLAQRARDRAALADQEAQTRESDYQAATPDSIAAGAGRVVGNIAIGGAGGGQLINLGRQAGLRAAHALGGTNAAAQFVGGGVGASAGSALLGSAWGGAQPVSEAGDYDALKSRQILEGGLVGAVVPGAAAALRGGVMSAGRTVRNLTQPLSEGGQQRIADRIIRDAARGGPTHVDNRQLVPGSRPTLAQATGNPNLAALERGLRNDPRLSNEIISRDTANAAARREAFERVAGDPSKLDFFRIHRETTANNLYGDAIVSYTGETTPYIKGQITQLLKRPSIDKASRKAQQWAIERGEKPDPKGSLRALHDVKGALDDMISEAVRKGAGGEAKALQATKAKLLDVMERMSPEYGLARQTYAEMSRPVNAMELLQGLKLTDARGNFTLSKVQNAIDSITRQRNMPGVNNAKSLNADELSVLTAIRDDLLRESNTGLGRAAGSPTMQNIAINNLLSDLVPGGNRLAQTALGGIAKRLGNVIYGGTDEPIRNALLERLMDPQLGAAALNGSNAGAASQLTNNALYRALSPYLLPASTVGITAGSSSR